MYGWDDIEQIIIIAVLIQLKFFSQSFGKFHPTSRKLNLSSQWTKSCKKVTGLIFAVISNEIMYILIYHLLVHFLLLNFRYTSIYYIWNINNFYFSLCYYIITFILHNFWDSSRSKYKYNCELWSLWLTRVTLRVSDFFEWEFREILMRLIIFIPKL